MIVGRDLWLFGSVRLLTQTAKVLLEQKWSILRPPEGLEWFTSDDPVVRLNYYAENRYDFKGGWEIPVPRYFCRLVHAIFCIQKWAFQDLREEQS